MGDGGRSRDGERYGLSLGRADGGCGGRRSSRDPLGHGPGDRVDLGPAVEADDGAGEDEQESGTEDERSGGSQPCQV